MGIKCSAGYNSDKSMEPETKAEDTKVTPAVTTETTPVVEQDPLKTELDKVQRKGRTRTEKLIFTRNRIDQQLKEEGVDINEVEDDEDTKPVTIGMLKKIQAESATKTALDLANEISNDTERELTKYHLENTIRSTGNPQQDFELAQGLVNAVKNRQILDETTRKPELRTHSSGAGAPAKVVKTQDDLTAEELSFTKPPFNMTKEQILKART